MSLGEAEWAARHGLGDRVGCSHGVALRRGPWGFGMAWGSACSQPCALAQEACDLCGGDALEWDDCGYEMLVKRGGGDSLEMVKPICGAPMLCGAMQCCYRMVQGLESLVVWKCFWVGVIGSAGCPLGRGISVLRNGPGKSVVSCLGMLGEQHDWCRGVLWKGRRWRRVRKLMSECNLTG